MSKELESALAKLRECPTWSGATSPCLSREEAAALLQRLEADDRHLSWLARQWGGQRSDFSAHVLRVGGVGDSNDVRSFIDAAYRAPQPAGGGG
jgi:hypothetical protein